MMDNLIDPSRLRGELDRRMGRPQRHRLLHGYPMAPVLRPVPEGFEPFDLVENDPARPLIVGVLPHTFCNPKVKGCGFCTFPHEKHDKQALRRTTEQVAREIELAGARAPWLRDRRVEAVYIGGGTANLTPPERLRAMWAQLASLFALRDSEVTLEGVPRYFLLDDEALLDMLAGLDVRHRRISMGVQTFDAAWLRKMGRDAFGDRATIERVVGAAQRRGFTTSADLLDNLPRDPPARALADVDTAIACGFDQICVYNLVLTKELDSVWARDPAMVLGMLAPTAACETWLAVRARLVERGYIQTTLTNFERANIAGTPRAFAYERASFAPATYDGIGFGPGAISTVTSRDRASALKWQNVPTSDAFAAAIAERGRAVASVFHYERRDLQLLQLTRGFATCTVHRELEDDFGAHFGVLEAAGLLARDGDAIRLTPIGMFYADAVTGLLAYDRITDLTGGVRDDRHVRRSHMG